MPETVECSIQDSGAEGNTEVRTQVNKEQHIGFTLHRNHCVLCIFHGFQCPVMGCTDFYYSSPFGRPMLKHLAQHCGSQAAGETAFQMWQAGGFQVSRA